MNVEKARKEEEGTVAAARAEVKNFTTEKCAEAKKEIAQEIGLFQNRMTTRMENLRDAQKSIDVEALQTDVMADLSVSLGKISANVDNSIAEVQRRDDATQAQLSALHRTISSINSCKCESSKDPKETPVSGKTSPRSEASSSLDLRRTVSARQLEKKKPWNPKFQRN